MLATWRNTTGFGDGSGKPTARCVSAVDGTPRNGRTSLANIAGISVTTWPSVSGVIDGWTATALDSDGAAPSPNKG